MPLGFGHLIGAWLFGRIYSRAFGTKLSKPAWAALLLGGNLPDIDYFIDWTTCFQIHRYFSHSLTAAIVVGIMLYILLAAVNFFREKKILQIWMIALFLSLGISIHILLDLIFTTSGMRIFWPVENSWWIIKGTVEHNIAKPTFEMVKQNLREATLDIALGVAWVWYLFLSKRLRIN